jgi:MFS family permease
VVRTPGVARLAAFATTGRLPFAIVPLSIVLLMREEAYDYGKIGAVVGAEALAVGVTAGFVGRLVDRVGRRQVILVTGAVTTLALTAETIAILSASPIWVLVAVAAVQGGTIPPISASMRSLWSQLVPEETLESAYAFDAIQLELVFVVGPLIAAGLATALTPQSACCSARASTPWPRSALQPRPPPWPPCSRSATSRPAREHFAQPACGR